MSTRIFFPILNKKKIKLGLIKLGLIILELYYITRI